MRRGIAWEMGACFILLASSSFALTERGEVGGVEYAIYAPAWTWQECDVNVLLKLVNKSAQPRAAHIALHLPGEYFSSDGKYITALNPVLGANSVSRHMLRTAAKGRGPAPVGMYELRLTLRVGDESVSVDYPLRVVRGALVRPGKWVMFVPLIVTLGWCWVFILVMPRFAAQGAWRAPGASVAPPEQLEEWAKA